MNAEFLNESRKISLIAVLWAVFVALFVLSTQTAARIKIASFYVPPSYLVIPIIISIFFVFPQILKLHGGVKIFVIGGATYLGALLLSSSINYCFYDYSLNLKTLFKWCVFVLTTILVGGTVRRKSEIVFLIKMVVISMTIISIYGIYYFYVSGHYVNPYWQMSTQNALLNWNAGVFIFPLFLFYYDYSFLKRGLWLVCLGVLLFAQIYTFSRTGWITILMSLFLFACIIKRVKIALLLMITLAMLTYLCSFYLPMVGHIVKRFDTISSIEKLVNSSRSRIVYGVKTGVILINNPVLGIGTDNFASYETHFDVDFITGGGTKNYTYFANISDVSHSLYFDIVSNSGVLGLSVLVFMLYGLFRFYKHVKHFVWKRRDEVLLKTLFLAVALYLFRGITSNEVFNMPITGFIFGLTLSCMNLMPFREDGQGLE